MFTNLFSWLSGMLSAAPAIALCESFIWGALSILLSPCHLSSIPLIVGFIDEQGKISTKRAFIISFLFSLGILITIASIGLITGLLGRMLGYTGPWARYFVVIVLVIMGLHLLEIIPLPFLSSSGQPSFQKKGLFASFLLGLLFGVALGPCTFAFMAPMLGTAFTVASTNLLFAFSLILAYALGHISVIIFAGTFTEVVQSYLNWNEKSKGAVILKKICGVLVIIGAVYLAASN